MDHRAALPVGSELSFPGMTCRIDGCLGRGSNAIVYEASYQDATSQNRKHHILVKELFPFDLHGHIWRGENRAICRDAEGQALWQTHLLSFQRGNDVHLQLLALQPGQLGGNINTFSLNDTLYSILDDSGSRSLEKELAGKPAHDLRTAALRCMRLLDCLEIFHRHNFLHLDISLDNALLIGEGEQERAMLIDYNSVHSRDEIQNRTALYFSMKEGFTAPEVQTGMYQELSFCTDLFSMTAVFYAMLFGKPPSTFQLNRKTPPDAQDSPLLTGAPSTVREQVKKIMRRGLCALPDKRYPTCAIMRKDLAELLNRLDGLGVSHAALWEAGRRSVQRLVKRNPALAYLEKEAELYPLRVTWEESGESLNLDAFMEDVSLRRGQPVLLEGVGGVGKSTALLRTVLSAPPAYSVKNPALIYVPLYEWRESDGNFILDQVLRELRFDANTRTMEDARHVLTEQLNKPISYKGESRPALLLLLDGLNEAAGDMSCLLREIETLSQLSGLSMVIASRVCPENLPVRKAHLDLLTDRDVQAALGRHGLLIPEKGEMRELLKTPLMLSLYIQTALGQNAQVQCETEKQLIDAYLDVLCDKAGQDGQKTRYQAEAAVRLVLPAIAREARKQGAALDDQTLLVPVLKCRGMIDTRTLARVFPEWIGHGAEITGSGNISDEAWYGQIVHEILWKRLGLLMRDQTGGYHIRHQIFQEYLLRMDAVNRASVRKARFRTGAVCAGALACLMCVLLLCYELWIKPKPYDETMSAVVLETALTQYISAGLQYEAMASMLDENISPEACAAEIRQWGIPASLSAQTALNAMRESEGTVIPWSNAAFDFESCLSLLALPKTRAESYPAYIRAFGRLLKEGREKEKAEFAAALSDLIEADADLAWLLDRAVTFPHAAGMTEERKAAYQIGLLSLPSIQESRSPDLSRGLDYAIQKAEERSREAQRTLAKMPVMYEEETE